MKTLLFKNPLIIFLLPLMVLVSAGLSAATITSTSTGGSWSVATTWVGGVVPTIADDVIIAAGATVTVRSPYGASSHAQCNSLTVDGILTLGAGAGSGARYLSVESFVTIDNGGVLNNDLIEIHYLFIGGDFINNGTFTPLSGPGSIEVSFTGSGPQLIDGNASQTFSNLVVNKPSGVLSVSGNVTSLSADTFTLTSGDFMAGTSFSVSGSFILTAGTFSAGSSLQLGGRFINNGSAFVAGSGTVFFNGISQTIEGTSPSTFNNITISGSSSTLVRTTTTIGGDLSIDDGTALSTQVALTVNGTTTIGGGTSGQFAITSTSGAKTFVGLVSILKGAVWDNSIVGGNVHFRGGLTNLGTFKDGTTGVNYFETNSQTIRGTIVMMNVDVNPAGVTLTNRGVITITNDISGGGTWAQGANSTLNLNGTYAIPMTASASKNTVNFTGGNQTTIAIGYVNLGLSGTGTKTLRTVTTSITGNLSLSGSVSSATVVGLTIDGNLSIAGSSSFTAANSLTVSGALSIGDGTTFTTANNLTVTGITTVGGSASGSLIISDAAGAKVFGGMVTISSGGTWNNIVDEDVHFQGGISNQGTFNAGAGSNYFDVNAQSLSGVITIPYLDVTTGVTLTNTGTLNATSNLTGVGNFIQANNAVLNLGSLSTINVIDAQTFNNTVNYSGGAQQVFDTNYVNLGLSGTDVTHVKTFQTFFTSSISGNLTLTGTTSANLVSAIAIGGNLSIDPNCSLSNGVSLTVAGSISGGGSLVQVANTTLTINGAATLASINGAASNNVVNYNAASPAIISGTYFNLYLNQSSGTASLNGNTTVGGTLTLNAGNLDLGSSNLTLDVAATVSIAAPSASSMIITSGAGEVRKNFNAIGAFTFPIGDATGTAEYSPITINVTSASGFTAGYVAASVGNSKYTSNKSSTDFLKRYWKVSQSGISNCVADVAGSYLMADINGTEANIAAGQLIGTFDQMTNGWKKFSALSGNTLSVAGASLTDGNISVFTGITGVNTSVTITGGDGPASCVGLPIQLGTTVTGDPTLVYVWTPAVGLNSTTIANPKAKPGSTTVYTVTIFDGNGFSASDNTTITVQQPTISVNSLAFCTGLSGDLTATGADTYVWSPATGLSATTGSTVTANPTTTTTYKVIGTDVNLCTDTVTTKVTVYQIPAKPTITAANLLTPTPKLTSSSASGNQWFKDGASLPGATNKNLTVSTDGSYTVQATVNGCVSDMSDPFAIVILGLENHGTMKVYPNPTTDFIHIDMGDFTAGAELEVTLFDILGRLQISKTVNSSDNSVDVKNFSKGTYIVIARQNDQLVVQKFIKN